MCDFLNYLYPETCLAIFTCLPWVATCTTTLKLYHSLQIPLPHFPIFSLFIWGRISPSFLHTNKADSQLCIYAFCISYRYINTNSSKSFLIFSFPLFPRVRAIPL